MERELSKNMEMTPEHIQTAKDSQIQTAKDSQTALTTEGQRKVNLIWEMTQALIAIAVVFANLIVGVHVGLQGSPGEQVPAMLTNSLFLVIGFYFSRTNHSAIGGVGTKPMQEYQGR